MITTIWVIACNAMSLMQRFPPFRDQVYVLQYNSRTKKSTLMATSLVEIYFFGSEFCLIEAQISLQSLSSHRHHVTTCYIYIYP